MKKAIWVVLILLTVFYIFLSASTWPSAVKVAFEFLVPDTTNTGNGAYAGTNNGSTGFSSTDPGGGVNSMGLFDSSSKNLTCNSVNEVIQTLQFGVHIVSSGMPAVAALWSTSDGNLMYEYGASTCYFYSPGSGQFACTLTRDADHEIIVNWDGTHADVYVDGTHQGQEVSYQPTNRNWVFGIRNAGEYCNCYEWNIVLSTSNSAGAQISPIVSTPTFTLTNPPATTPTFTKTPNVAATQTQAAVETLTATWNTPATTYTPACPVIPTLTPGYPAVFTEQPTPIIVSAGPSSSDGGCVVEPNIIDLGALRGISASDRYQCVYSADAFLHVGYEHIDFATAPEPWGPWTKHGTIVGNGYGGVAGNARMSSQLYISGHVRVYFQYLLTGGVDYMDSTDGYTFTLVGYPVNPEALPAAATGPLCPGGTNIDGMQPFYNNGGWWATAEMQNGGSCSLSGSPIPGAYILGLFKGNSDASQFTFYSIAPLYGMGPSPSVNSQTFAGGRAVIEATSGHIFNFTHCNTPTFLYCATSGGDMFNWYTYTRYLFDPAALDWGLPPGKVDQTADSTVLQRTDSSGGKMVVLVYDRTDNSDGYAAIGYSLFHGSIDNFDNCLVPSPTITPTFTRTPTPTFTATPTITPQAVVTISASTTMILGQQYTVNLAGSLIGNFMSSNEEFLYSYANFNIVGQTPTPSIPGTYYNDGPKNGTYSESVSIQLIPLTPGNYNLFGDYITYLANGNAFNNYNSLNINVITCTPTNTPTTQSTASNTPNWTPTPTYTPIIINTSTFTDTPTPATQTFTPMNTSTRTATPNVTATFTPTITRTSTITPTPIIVTILPISTTTISVCTESYNLTGALGYVIEFIPTGYEVNVPVWDNISANPFYFQYLVNMSGVPNRSKITGIELFVKKNNSNTGAWVLQGPQPVWTCL